MSGKRTPAGNIAAMQQQRTHGFVEPKPVEHAGTDFDL
jgi:hypothetical protein